MKINLYQYPVLILLLFLSSCKLNKGFVLYNSRNVTNNPGSIYRIGKDNKILWLVNYNDGTPLPSPIELSKSGKSIVVSVGTLLSFLSDRDTTINSNFKANSKKDITINIKLVQGQLYQMTDQDMKKYNRDLTKRILYDMESSSNAGSRYFLLREAVSAKEIDIDLSYLFSSDPILESRIKQALSGKANVTWINSNEVKISLEEDERVLYKVARIVIVRKGSNGNINLKFEPSNSKDANLLEIGN